MSNPMRHIAHVRYNGQVMTWHEYQRKATA